jgi:hypothetical protein
MVFAPERTNPLSAMNSAVAEATDLSRDAGTFSLAFAHWILTAEPVRVLR